MIVFTYTLYFLLLALLAGGCIKAWISHRYRLLEKQYNPLFQDLIHRHIYLNPDLYRLRTSYIDLALDDFRKHGLDNRDVRKILVDMLLKCREHFPGEKKRLLKKLYRDLDLELYTIIELNFLKGEDYVAAVNELMLMEVEIDTTKINPFLKSSDSRIRSVTRAYLASMKNFSREFSLEEYERGESAVLT